MVQPAQERTAGWRNSSSFPHRKQNKTNTKGHGSDAPVPPDDLLLLFAGVVYNYDAEGVQRAGTGWEQCISVPLVQPHMFGLLQQWDQLLEEFSAGQAWLPHRYDEHEHNCYTYALAFINSILTAQGKREMSKSEFTERFVIPQTKRAARYITVHQELTANEFYIVPLPQQEELG